MTFEKTAIASMSMPYAITSFVVDGARHVVCATEDHGPALIIAPPYRQARPLIAGPGGCMSLLPDEKSPGELFAIMECYLLYKFQGGGIFRIRRGPAGWAARRVLDLPFAHRIELVDRPDGRYLVAANLAADKADAADWSRPGAVHAARLSPDSEPVTGLEPVLSNVHKNHGLLLGPVNGKRLLLVGTAEGLFSIDVEAPGPGWPARQLTSTETSEMAVLDLDGDGREELVTIEPFHGTVLRAYRWEKGGWRVTWEAELAFGHCVLAFPLDGTPGILVSNRAGDKSLLYFRFEAAGKPRRIVVDPGVGAANMTALRHDGRQRIFSANQATGEIAMYTAAGTGD